jgi:hypothetical protein
MNENMKAFVIMPFDAEFKSIYEDLIKPALEDVGYDVARADSFLDQQSILRDIVRGIATADLIVADLTTLSPNVLYELGLCHGLRIPTILLAQSMDEVPFDLRSYRIQIYSTRFDQVHKLKQALKDVGERHKFRTITFGSPVTDFLPNETHALREKVTEIITKPVEEPLKVETIEEVEEEKGVLDLVIEGSKAAEEITSTISEISKETVNFGDKMKDRTARLQALTANQRPGTARQIYQIALMIATDMAGYSEKIEVNLPILEKSIDVLTESFSSYITWIEPKSEEDRGQVIRFRQSIAGLLEGAKGGIEGLRSLRDAVTVLKGISKDISRASRRLAQTLDGVISAIEKVEAFGVRTLPLIDEKLGNQLQSGGGTGA